VPGGARGIGRLGRQQGEVFALSDPPIEPTEHSARDAGWVRTLFTGRRRRWVVGIVLINLVGVLVLAGIGSAHTDRCGGFSGYSGGGGGGNCEADIFINPYTAPSPVHVGQRLIYLLTVRNQGPDEAYDIHLVVRIPKGVQVNWWMSSEGRYGGGCTYVNRIVDCFFYAGIGKGASVAATVVIVPYTVGVLRTTVSAHSEFITDPHPHNNNVTIKTTVTA
jgi:uncharacterized repeat protein (TIGR01451 family)